MAESGRAKAALARNLPNKGWKFEGSEGTFQDLKLVLGEEEWVMTKTEGDKQVEVATGLYGKSQMNDVKKAASTAGQAFASAGKGGSGGGRKAQGETRTVDPEKKKLMAQKRQEKVQAHQKEEFVETLVGNGWTKGEKDPDKFGKDGFVVALAVDSWVVSKGRKQLGEGTYASKAYAVVEAVLEEKGS